jgi:hypothetical protein
MTFGLSCAGQDCGAVGLLTLVSGLVASVLALAVVFASAAAGVTAARARTAADAAALAAMGVSPLIGGAGAAGGTDGSQAAEREAARAAAANGASVVLLDTSGWPFRVTVEVRTGWPPLLASTGLPPLRAHATAAARPAGRSAHPAASGVGHPP